MKKLTGVGIMVFALAVVFASCGGGGGSASLVSIAVTPGAQSIATGATRQFTATGTYSDGSTKDLTGTVTWISSDETRATVNAAGLATAASNAAGSATITATSDGVSGSAVLKVIVNLPKTGQTKCYDAAGAEIACANTGQDGDKLAGVAWPNPRFTVTYCDANGPCADQSSDCDSNAATDVVTDNLTGLMWVKAPDFTTRTWQAALDHADALPLCGHTDWRLPNRRELRSLVDYSRYNPVLQPGHPFSNVPAGNYWSSTTYAGRTAYAWYVSMSVGFVFPDFKSINYYVWPVRSGQ